LIGRSGLSSGAQIGLSSAAVLRRPGQNSRHREHRSGRVQTQPRKHQEDLQRSVQLSRGQVQNRRQRKLYRVVTQNHTELPSFPLNKKHIHNEAVREKKERTLSLLALIAQNETSLFNFDRNRNCIFEHCQWPARQNKLK